jgi:hypothetical protein
MPGRVGWVGQAYGASASLDVLCRPNVNFGQMLAQLFIVRSAARHIIPDLIFGRLQALFRTALIA